MEQRIQQVVAEYDEREATRRQRVQRAMAEAATALGGSRAALDEVKKSLKRVVRGKLESAAFVEACLAPRCFGQSSDGAAALVALIETMPEEHTALREQLLAMIAAATVGSSRTSRDEGS